MFESPIASQDSSNDQPASVWWTGVCANMRAHVCGHACVCVYEEQQQRTLNTGLQHGVEAPRDTTALNV